jgi:hypothetical protein
LTAAKSKAIPEKAITTESTENTEEKRGWCFRYFSVALCVLCGEEFPRSPQRLGGEKG